MGKDKPIEDYTDIDKQIKKEDEREVTELQKVFFENGRKDERGRIIDLINLYPMWLSVKNNETGEVREVSEDLNVILDKFAEQLCIAININDEENKK